MTVKQCFKRLLISAVNNSDCIAIEYLSDKQLQQLECELNSFETYLEEIFKCVYLTSKQEVQFTIVLRKIRNVIREEKKIRMLLK